MAVLAEHQPLGVILFARNVEAPAQLRRLTDELKRLLPAGAVIMVDQEGGRVARLRPPHWRAHPPARALRTERAAYLTGALIGVECAEAGFDLVAAPVLDVADPQGHDVIGDRAFSDDPARVAALGAAFAAGLLVAGVQPVREAESLTSAAQIRYMRYDMQPATHSAAIISRIIRAPGAIGFQGVLVSDDLAMGALSGTPGDRARRALAAGCDVALHCSGVLQDTVDVLRSAGDAGPACLARLAAGRDMAEAARQALDAGAIEAERAALLA